MRRAHAVHDGPDLVERAARECGDADDGRPGGKRHATRNAHHDVLALLVGAHEVPLVEQDDERAAALDRKACDLLVLFGDALGGVHDEQAHVRLVDGAKAPDEAVVLDVLVHEVALAHASGVDESVALALALHDHVECVTRGAGDVAHDGAVLSGKAVGDGGLAHVRAADDCHPKGVLGILGLLGLLGQGRHDLVEQVSRAVSVNGRDGPGLAESQGVEVPQGLLVRGVVKLVGHEEDRLARAAQDAGDRLVLVRDARGCVDDEDDDVGLDAGGLGLLADAAGEGVVGAAGLDAARVNEREVHAVPVGVMVAAVARDAAALMDDGFLLLGYAVHQCRLADVGSADDGDDGLGHACSLLGCT